MSSPSRIRLRPSEVRLLLSEKGWSVSNLAFFWDKMARETLSRLISDPRRPRHWDDAFRGVPILSFRSAQALSKERLAARPRKGILRKPGIAVNEPWLAAGALVRAGVDIGYLANEGAEGLILQVMSGSSGFRYQVQWPGGVDLVDERQLKELAVETGRSRPPSTRSQDE